MYGLEPEILGVKCQTSGACFRVRTRAERLRLRIIPSTLFGLGLRALRV